MPPLYLDEKIDTKNKKQSTPISCIIPGLLYLGSKKSAHNKTYFEEYNIKTVINATYQVPNYFSNYQDGKPIENVVTGSLKYKHKLKNPNQSIQNGCDKSQLLNANQHNDNNNKCSFIHTFSSNLGHTPIINNPNLRCFCLKPTTQTDINPMNNQTNYFTSNITDSLKNGFNNSIPINSETKFMNNNGDQVSKPLTKRQEARKRFKERLMGLAMEEIKKRDLSLDNPHQSDLNKSDITGNTSNDVDNDVNTSNNTNPNDVVKNMTDSVSLTTSVTVLPTSISVSPTSVPLISTSVSVVPTSVPFTSTSMPTSVSVLPEAVILHNNESNGSQTKDTNITPTDTTTVTNANNSTSKKIILPVLPYKVTYHRVCVWDEVWEDIYTYFDVVTEIIHHSLYPHLTTSPSNTFNLVQRDSNCFSPYNYLNTHINSYDTTFGNTGVVTHNVTGVVSDPGIVGIDTTLTNTIVNRPYNTTTVDTTSTSISTSKMCTTNTELEPSTISPGAVLVHCQAGRSRSAILVMAYLCRYGIPYLPNYSPSHSHTNSSQNTINLSQTTSKSSLIDENSSQTNTNTSTRYYFSSLRSIVKYVIQCRPIVAPNHSFLVQLFTYYSYCRQRRKYTDKNVL